MIQREAHLLGLVGERRRRLGPAEADAEREARQAVLGEAADVLALGPEEPPTPSPVVIRSSPPSSQGVGSGSSETWTQRIGLLLPPSPR